MTNHWVDIKNANLILIMGGNAAEAHPCGFKWVTEAKAHNKAKLIVADPRFTRSAAVADYYAPIRAGTDIAFLGGVINYLLTNDKIQHEYVKAYTDVSFIVRADYTFEDGLFSGYNEAKRKYDKDTWMYELGADGYVKTDPTLTNPRCVFNLMKAHYARYTPEMVSSITGTPKEQFLKVCEMIAETSAPNRTMTIMYALGWTQHSVGSQMIRTAAMVQLLLGNIGMAGGGMNALRGHSNIQGLTDPGLVSELLTGDLTLPGGEETDCKAKVGGALKKLKYLVTIDPLVTETSTFWENHGEYNDVDPAKIQTEVFRLPSTCFAEENGSLVSSSRVLQWHWKGADPPGEAKSDIEIMAGIFMKLRQLYRKEGGAVPDALLNLTLNYAIPLAPSPEEIAREFSGKALDDLMDPKDKTKVVRKAGEQLDGFGQLTDDGKTSCGCWIFAGAWSEKGNLMAGRDNSDPSGLGNTLNWAYSWPANRRVQYNRASCDPSGKPWDPNRKLIGWDGAKWSGADVPDIKPDAAPAEGMNPFIMNPEGVARFFAVDRMAEGPFPEHYEPFESPLAVNPLHPKNPKAKNNPAARVFKDDLDQFGDAEEFPYVATTYRLTEHFHFWTKHTRLAAIMQPEQFVEIGEELAQMKGIKNGDRVRVRSIRGFIKAVAVVTKRIRTLEVYGKKVYTVGIPIHWGFQGLAKNGFIANTLTPSVGDGNTNTPEFKAFLVTVDKL